MTHKSNRIIKKIFLLFISLIILSCVAPATQGFNMSDQEVKREQNIQKELAILQSRKYQKRIDTVALPILRENRDLCGSKITYYLGFSFETLLGQSNDWKEAYISSLNLNINNYKVVNVIEGSSAHKAGILQGDILVSINDVKVGTTEQEIKSFRKRLQNIQYKLDSAKIVVRRDGLTKNIRYSPERICDYNTTYDSSDNLNAYADGENIVISKGMMRFVEDDTELALIIAHELAHNAMGHIQAKQTNAVPGLMLDLLGAYVGVNTQGTYANLTSQMFSKEFETEADYVGIYYLYRANYEIDNVSYFWRRMSAENAGSIAKNRNSTHPSSPERFIQIEKTVEEIYRKEKNGEPIKPNVTIPNNRKNNSNWEKRNNWD